MCIPGSDSHREYIATRGSVMSGRLIGIPLKLSVSLAVFVAVAIPQATTAYADAVSTATICAQAAARCTGNCEPNSQETYHGCYTACMHRYDYCMKKWGGALNVGPGGPPGHSVTPILPTRTKPPPLKGTNPPSKPLRPVSTKPPPSAVSNNPGGGSPAGGTIFVDHPHHGR